MASAPSSGSGLKRKTPEEYAEEMKKNLTPEEYDKKLEEAMAKAMACPAPPEKGFKVIGDKSEKISQLRQLNVYMAQLKSEIDDQDQYLPGHALPVGAADEVGGSPPQDLEEQPAHPDEEGEGEKKKKKKKKKKDDKKDEDDAENPTEKEGKKKRKRR